MSNEGILIKVEEKDGTPYVNARELWKGIESKKRFSDWIKRRIGHYGFEEGKDFEVIHQMVKNLNGGRPEIEYLLTLDMAKELSMVEGTEKGREVRRYFIEVEKKYRAGGREVAGDFRAPMLQVLGEMKDAAAKVGKLAAVYSETSRELSYWIEDTTGCFNLSEAAVALSIPKIRLIEYLKQFRLRKEDGTITDFAIDNAYLKGFTVKLKIETDAPVRQTFVTSDGLAYLYKKISE
jgi:phage anti-repressor protein